MDRGGWWAAVHVVTQSCTRLREKQFLLLYDLILVNYVYNNPIAK